jgi:hypothetical protein
MNKERLKRVCYNCEKAIDDALGNAYDEICIIVQECGGVIKTPASSDKITLYAYYGDAVSTASEAVAIHGLRYDKELGLCICTNDMLDNYQFDNDYEFEYYFDFEGKDLENLNKALDDPAYYVEFDRYDLVFADTVRSIIGGLPDYLDTTD